MKRAVVVLACAALLACSGDSAGPPEPAATLAVRAGDAQYAVPGELIPEPLEVFVTRGVTGDPASDVEVRWRVASGSGASLTETVSRTDTRGVAITRLRVGSAAGTYVVEASTSSMTNGPARFEMFAVLQPVVSSVLPASAAAGETIVIQGENFGAGASVIIDDLRARVTSATATELRAVVPACVPTAQSELRVTFGTVTSAPVSLATTAIAQTPLDLALGASRTLTGNELDCFALPGTQGFLLAVQNTAAEWGPRLRYELGAELENDITVTAHTATAGDFEAQLRAREAALDGPLAAREPFAIASAVPDVGDRRTFSVLRPDFSFKEIRADVRAVGRHAVIYIDEEAPDGGFTASAITHLLELFDDWIYPTDVALFGQPSDLDANDRVVILFTPAVNQLTPRGSNSFIAGYFYGCDLREKQQCSGSNRGEVFYSLVPDPNAVFGSSRTVDDVLDNVPAVLAHELQHMIHFTRRNGSLDALWLSEALAHEAERQVQDAMRASGNTDERLFGIPNRVRARAYLRSTDDASLLGPESPGSLEFRGGAWLLLRFLMGRHGEAELLRTLTNSTRTGVDNVETATGRNWSDILADFAIASWADGSTIESALPSSQQFTNLDLRAEFMLTAEAGIVPSAFLRAGELEAASFAMFLVQPDAQSVKRRVRLQGWDGLELHEAASPQLVILRYQ